MGNMYRIFLVGFGFVVSLTSLTAAEVPTNLTKISRIDSYTSATTVGGDIVIFTEIQGPCAAYVIQGNDTAAASKNILAIATAAYMADKSVIIYADNAKQWRGASMPSSGVANYCLINLISLRKQ